jgi:hypothetical protein
VDTPLVTDLDRWQLLALDHALQRSHRYSQQLSRLLKSQTAQLIKVLFRRQFASQTSSPRPEIATRASVCLILIAALLLVAGLFDYSSSARD